MPAPKDNRFWQVRAKHGRDKIFSSPEMIWESACEYFEWVDKNPLWAYKVAQYQGNPVKLPEPKMRAMTLAALCRFLHIARQTWEDYCKRPEFSEVCEKVEDVIRDQKFTGAAADLLNAGLVMRDLGLADKQEHTGKGGAPIQTEIMGVKEIGRRLAYALAQAADESA